ncbi:hypothetical protein BC937DRAFT_91978 [Endogone sp. FLAS-F59071]|nr:hypothetical protein BC937DRAFT_91978 [Endogone sp. FLAS-F59071]|eukprot:RUS15802.1 hypothetical protein BC937DRAFT_91978 [Endogone sp. FLAS-F59071]
MPAYHSKSPPPMPIIIPKKRSSPEPIDSSSLTKIMTTSMSFPFSESPRTASSFRDSRPSSPLTLENLSIHTRQLSFDPNVDSVSFIMDRYNGASPLSSETGDSRPSNPEQRKSHRKHHLHRERKASDLVLTPSRALPFPYHNDSFFLPVAEYEPTSPTLTPKIYKAKSSSLPSPIRSISPSPSIRTRSTVPTSSMAPSISKRPSSRQSHAPSPQIVRPSNATPVRAIDEATQPTKPLLYRQPSERTIFSFNFSTEKRQQKAPKENIIIRLWRFLTSISSTKKQVPVDSPIREKSLCSNSPTSSIVFVT